MSLCMRKVSLYLQGVAILLVEFIIFNTQKAFKYSYITFFTKIDHPLNMSKSMILNKRLVYFPIRLYPNLGYFPIERGLLKINISGYLERIDKVDIIKIKTFFSVSDIVKRIKKQAMD